MEKKITYLLGAGASCHSVPIVKDLSTCLDSISSDINLILKDKSKNLGHEGYMIESILKEKDFAENISKNFKDLSVYHREFGTIDTYAKYLHIMRGKEGLENLRYYLSIFFILHHYYFYKHYNTTLSGQFEQLDKRYTTFLINVMSEKKFPEDIKVLSWNYDFQFQLASTIFDKNGEGEFYNDRKDNYGVRLTDKKYPKLSYWPALGNKIRDPISLYHLNGIAGFAKGKGYDNCNSIFNYFKSAVDNHDPEFINKIKLFMSEGEPLLKFAWEHEKLFEDIKEEVDRDDLINHLNESDILVIIGYSFPLFNRNIDKEIFYYFTNQFKKTKTVYYQNIKKQKQYLKEQFNLGDTIIEHVKAVDNFLIPYEY